MFSCLEYSGLITARLQGGPGSDHEGAGADHDAGTGLNEEVHRLETLAVLYSVDRIGGTGAGREAEGFVLTMS